MTATADVLHQLHPYIINILSLTIFPETGLYQEVQDCTDIKAPEIAQFPEEELKAYRHRIWHL